MTDYSKFRKSEDMIDWLRAPQAQQFSKEIDAKLVVAHENLVATCHKSTDPKVTAAVTQWIELSSLGAFLRNARKDRADE